ncbi:hypothetical protein K9N68_39095 (plasmid) [Kovacikia minuta CCNUW1]|nr:hypothetical protein [Kovacikia minuta]UBF30151.1 hypothetical protein K9N68_39095 [Kovacikia minuta CCNUW1]
MATQGDGLDPRQAAQWGYYTLHQLPGWGKDSQAASKRNAVLETSDT